MFGRFFQDWIRNAWLLKENERIRIIATDVLELYVPGLHIK